MAYGEAGGPRGATRRAVMTNHEVEAALDVAMNVEMVFIALSALCWDGFAVAIRDRDDEPLYSAGRDVAPIRTASDLYAVRTACACNRPHPVARYTAQAEQSRQ